MSPQRQSKEGARERVNARVSPEPRSEGRGSPPPEARERAPFEVTLEGVPIELVVTAARGRLMLEVDEMGEAHLDAAAFRVDDGPWDPLDRVGGRWRRVLSTDELPPGEHEIEVVGADPEGKKHKVSGVFRVRSGQQ